jgi:hypothetical protein
MNVVHVRPERGVRTEGTERSSRPSSRSTLDVARSRGNVRDVVVADEDLTVVGSLETCDHPQRHPLPAPDGPTRTLEFIVVDEQIELVDCRSRRPG